MIRLLFLYFFFFNDTATTEIYTLSLHDALPIFHRRRHHVEAAYRRPALGRGRSQPGALHQQPQRPLRRSRRRRGQQRSEEHTSELQSQSNLVCRLLLEKKKKK